MLTIVGMHGLRSNISTFLTVIITPIASIAGLFILALIFNLLLGHLGEQEAT